MENKQVARSNSKQPGWKVEICAVGKAIQLFDTIWHSIPQVFPMRNATRMQQSYTATTCVLKFAETVFNEQLHRNDLMTFEEANAVSWFFLAFASNEGHLKDDFTIVLRKYMLEVTTSTNDANDSFVVKMVEHP
jgi:hypothetical protein